MLGKVVVEVSGRVMTGESSDYADALKEGLSTAQRDLKAEAMVLKTFKSLPAAWSYRLTKEVVGS